jgi:hypothetical protein
MTMKFATHLLCLLVGAMTGYFAGSGSGSDPVDIRPTETSIRQSATGQALARDRPPGVLSSANDHKLRDSPPATDGDIHLLPVSSDVLTEFARYLRVTALSQNSIFEPSEDSVKLFSLSTGEHAAVKQALANAFAQLADAEAAAAMKVSDPEKGDYWKIPPLKSAAEMKNEFIDALKLAVGDARALALGSILSDSVLLGEFGAFPRAMYLEERIDGSGSKYFMLTQKRLADDLNEESFNFGSQSIFIPSSDVERRFARLYEASATSP